MQILRWQAETARFAAGWERLGMERDKLFTEALKMERERWWYPFAIAIIGGAATAVFIKVVS